MSTINVKFLYTNSNVKALLFQPAARLRSEAGIIYRNAIENGGPEEPEA
jgi:hypothetical protein